MKKQQGFSLVELMVVIAIIAILAAVAIPMFSTYKQKTKVGTALRACSGVSGAMQAYHNARGNLGFTGLSLSSVDGGPLMIQPDGIKLGVGLPQVPNMEWSITTITASRARISMTWLPNSGCPVAACNARYCISCSQKLDTCYIDINVGDGRLGFDRASTGDAAPGSCPP